MVRLCQAVVSSLFPALLHGSGICIRHTPAGTAASFWLDVGANFAQNALDCISEMGASCTNSGLADPDYAEDAAFCILDNFDFQLFTAGIVVQTCVLNGGIQVFALEFLEPIHDYCP